MISQGSGGPLRSQKTRTSNIKVFKPTFVEKSAALDTIDPIYYEPDPIDTSVKIRKSKGGSVLGKIENKEGSGSVNLPFFYTMELNGQGLVLDEIEQYERNTFTMASTS